MADSPTAEPQPGTALAERALAALRRVFSYQSFRGSQLDIIVAACSGKDTFTVQATGSGKSLCYQLPSLIHPHTVTLVISPLISLMEDQVAKLSQLGVPACMISSQQSDSDRKQAERGAMQGEYAIVYVTPERITLERWLYNFAQSLLTNKGQKDRRYLLSLIAVDEAHCVSEWGHDFRPHYRLLGNLRSNLPSSHPEVAMMALTATATPRVRQEIVEELGLRNPDVWVGSFDRRNLFYEVRRKNNRGDLVSTVRKGAEKDDEQDGLQGWERGSTVIYCSTRDETVQLAALLSHNGIPALPYHAGLSASDRATTQRAFAFSKCRVVVATVAFGMGIDKADVRLVVHWGLAKAVEQYYQQTGRAGRDGLFSKCILFYDNTDLSRAMGLAGSDGARVAALFEDFRRYTSFGGCRRKYLLEYFGEEVEWTDCNGMCDSCAASAAAATTSVGSAHQVPLGPSHRDLAAHAYLLLCSVQATGGRYGMRVPIDLLQGAKTKKVETAVGGRIVPVAGKGNRVISGMWDFVFSELQSKGFILTNPNNFSKFTTTYSVSAAGRKYIDKFTESGAAVAVLKDPPPATPKLPKGTPTMDVEVPTWLLEQERSSATRSSRPASTPLSQVVANASARSRASPAAVNLSAQLTTGEFEVLNKITELTQEISEREFNGLNPELVLSSIVLRGIAKRRPSSVEAFGRCEGVGQHRGQRLGPKFVPLIVRTCQLLNLDLDVRLPGNFIAPPAQNLLNGHAYDDRAATIAEVLNSDELSKFQLHTKESFRLWLEGEDLQKIADLRGVKPSTVHENVCKMIEACSANTTPHLIFTVWDRFGIADDKRDIILQAMENLTSDPSKEWDGVKLRTVMDEIGDYEHHGISWDDVKATRLWWLADRLSHSDGDDKKRKREPVDESAMGAEEGGKKKAKPRVLPTSFSLSQIISDIPGKEFGKSTSAPRRSLLGSTLQNPLAILPSYILSRQSSIVMKFR
ncbi:ATP-dependent DNA helicase [Gonapodya prolifera JEL478]|uniref:ATP-dependent DNA helicase n=1 Tax=Gonapodya prolifera (strain JEL478) TaxID=1344416 RepID=A0A139AWE5_GONPJ|nr:ATP-dependent DNA helicase [Gonapodya prolifera JEL478]|eukprot:KXS21029.1 ATP-dependent DNA helicase [Gonapodya prolifera JEL478]